MLGSAPRRFLSVALITTALLLTACGSTPPATPAAAPKPTEAAKPTAAPAAASPVAAAASPAAGAASPAVAGSPAVAASPATAASPAASPAAGASPAASPAAAASPIVNGEVDSVDGRVLSVVTNTGVRKVSVPDNATILMEGYGTPADLSKTGALVAVTGKPDGTALIVRFFPPGISPRPSSFPMTGAQAGNIMTNATIDSFDGTTLTVDLAGPKVPITVTPDTKIVRPMPSNFSEIKPGRRVVAFGTTDGDTLTVQSVTITLPS